MDLEPLFFEPVYKDYIWGGTKLKTVFNKNTPFDKTAESWEIASNKNGESIVKSGIYKSKTISELFSDKSIKKYIFGDKCENLDKFPLLIKFIDANSNLSVQVHPNDKYAKEVENDTGKTEMWYILDCIDNAKLICGTKNLKNEEKSEKLTQSNIEEFLNYIDISKGNVIYIPSGTVHAILGGAFICEIQQNSDLTYRLYDWGRLDKNGKPRELHTSKAIDVIDVNISGIAQKTNSEGYKQIINSEYFKVDKAVVNNLEPLHLKSKNESFLAINVINGSGQLTTNDKKYKLNLGDSFIIPAYIGEFDIVGNIELLISYV